MKRRRILIIVIAAGSFIFTSATFYLYQIFYTPNILVEKPGTYVQIPSGSSFHYIRNMMYDSGYLHEPVSFSFLGKFFEYDQSLKPGRYLLESNLSNKEVLDLLRSGRQAPTSVTFNNVRLKSELAEKLCRNIEIDPSSFDQLLLDSAQAAKYGFQPETFITMFIPNTYEVYWTITTDDLMARMHTEYERFWNEDRRQKAELIGLSPIEVSILASIVNAESKKREEGPRIAGLYMNRLKRKIALQADPTLVYAVGDFTIKRVLNKHKAIDSPYNTYKYRGLPPGPINLPPINAIDAVLNYEKHKYLYMCAREDFSGYHNFATNLVAHLKNADIYQRALNRARLYR